MKAVKVIIVSTCFLIALLLLIYFPNNLSQFEYFPLVADRVLFYKMYSTKNFQWTGDKVLTFTGPDANNVYTVRDETTGHASIIEIHITKKPNLDICAVSKVIVI